MLDLRPVLALRGLPLVQQVLAADAGHFFDLGGCVRAFCCGVEGVEAAGKDAREPADEDEGGDLGADTREGGEGGGGGEAFVVDIEGFFDVEVYFVQDAGEAGQARAGHVEVKDAPENALARFVLEGPVGEAPRAAVHAEAEGEHAGGAGGAGGVALFAEEDVEEGFDGEGLQVGEAVFGGEEHLALLLFGSEEVADRGLFCG